MSKGSTQNAAGFTLVEVLVALTILSISLAVVLQVFSISLASTSESEAEMTATLLSQSLLDGAGGIDPLRVGESQGEFPNGFRWRLQLQKYGSPEDQKAWPSGAIAVSATVSWDQDKRAVTLKTLHLAPQARP